VCVYVCVYVSVCVCVCVRARVPQPRGFVWTRALDKIRFDSRRCDQIPPDSICSGDV
jgi:hypothetical protein